MGYWRQFENVDPLIGQVPYWPFGRLSSIAWQARSLLRNRTSDQIALIANLASDSIDEYFSQAKENEIARLRREEAWEFFYIDDDGNIHGLNSERESELDFPTSDNTNDIDALSESVGGWCDIFDDGTPDPEDYEYFAAMALWKVADAIYKVTYNYDYNTREDIKKDRQKLTTSDLSIAGDIAIEAMEAVCYAVNLRDSQRQEERLQEKIKAAETHASAKVQRENDLKWESLQAEEARQKSENAKKMAALSKASRDKSMAAVLSQWDKDAALQKLSSAKAGIKLSQWLGTQDLEPFEPRTVSQWISAHKKEKSAI